MEHSSESGESFVSESRNSESALDYSPESESSSETELLPETESKFTEHLFKKPESPSSLEASSPDTPFGPYPLDLEPLESVFKKSARQPTYPSESGLNNFNKKFNGNIFHRDYESSESNNQTESVRYCSIRVSCSVIPLTIGGKGPEDFIGNINH